MTQPDINDNNNNNSCRCEHENVANADLASVWRRRRPMGGHNNNNIRHAMQDIAQLCVFVCVCQLFKLCMYCTKMAAKCKCVRERQRDTRHGNAEQNKGNDNAPTDTKRCFYKYAHSHSRTQAHTQFASYQKGVRAVMLLLNKESENIFSITDTYVCMRVCMCHHHYPIFAIVCLLNEFQVKFFFFIFFHFSELTPTFTFALKCCAIRLRNFRKDERRITRAF